MCKRCAKCECNNLPDFCDKCQECRGPDSDPSFWGYIKSDKKCIVGLTDCSKEDMLYQGTVCGVCIVDYPYIVDQLIGTNFLELEENPEERIYYRYMETYCNPKKRMEVSSDMPKFDIDSWAADPENDYGGCESDGGTDDRLIVEEIWKTIEQEEKEEKEERDEREAREQAKYDYHDAKEQLRCSNLDYDDITPDDEYHNRIFLEKSLGYSIYD